MVMRVATWNVNGLRARLDFLSGWLRERKPDLIGLQELKLTVEQFPREHFAGLGYHALVHGQKAWNGVAVLSREPAKLLQKGLPGQEDFGARLLCAEVGGLVFITVYCPNGKQVGHEDFSRKLRWLEALEDFVRGRFRSDMQLIIGGDFNICPAGLDSWDEERLRGSIFHTDEERHRLQKLLDWGLSDVFRERHPRDQSFSWWDYRGGAFHRGQGLRLDLLLASKPVMARVREVEIDRSSRRKKEGITPSDHAPVVVDLE